MKRSIFASLATVLLLAGCGASPHTSRTPSRPAGTQSAGGSVHPPGWGQQGPPPTFRLSLSPAQTATMYDSIVLGTIPARPFAAAGYSGGAWPTYPQIRRAYPQTHTVSIAVFPWEHAACLDVEPGDATPFDVAGWVRADQRAGYRKPCVYSSWWEFTQEVRPALARAGIARTRVYQWDADYTYRPHIDAGFDATQWTDRCLGRNLDCSLVLRSFLAAAQPPLAAPTPPKPKPTPTISQLVRTRALLRADLTRRRCRVAPYHGRGRYHRICAVWLREGRAVNRQLHGKGIR